MKTIKELEEDIFNIEGIRVFFRLKSDLLVKEYTYKKKMVGTKTLGDLINGRFKNLEVMIFDEWTQIDIEDIDIIGGININMSNLPLTMRLTEARKTYVQ